MDLAQQFFEIRLVRRQLAATGREVLGSIILGVEPEDIGEGDDEPVKFRRSPPFRLFFFFCPNEVRTEPTSVPSFAS